jgi:hypothetical protein
MSGRDYRNVDIRLSAGDRDHDHEGTDYPAQTVR